VKAIRRVGITAGLLAMLVFALGGAAWASTGQSGPTPPKIGDPVGTNTSPHGGYDSTSNFCLQCHAVHNAGGEYGLMWKSSVTNTCKTCHGYMGATFDGTRDPVGPGSIGTTSLRTVYDVVGTGSDHQIGSSSVPGDSGVTITQSDFSYGWRRTYPTADATTAAGAGTSADIGGGLYCASCHTPHADFGMAANTKKVWVRPTSSAPSVLVDWAQDAQVWTVVGTTPTLKYLNKTAGGSWQLCDSAGGGGTCVDATIADSEGQTVSLYGYKLLSAHPNHTYSKFQSWGTDYRKRDQAGWCGVCHKSMLDESLGGPAGSHTHPTACDYCHGNPSDASSADFPHSSTMGKLLKQYPDALCVSCHTASSLP